MKNILRVLEKTTIVLLLFLLFLDFSNSQVQLTHTFTRAGQNLNYGECEGVAVSPDGTVKYNETNKKPDRSRMINIPPFNILLPRIWYDGEDETNILLQRAFDSIIRYLYLLKL